MLSDAPPATREQIIDAALNLQPKEALGFFNGDQASRCTTKVFCKVITEDGSIIDLDRDAEGRVGCVYPRVSTIPQRSKRVGKVANGDGNKNALSIRKKIAASILSDDQISSVADEFDLDQAAEAESREEMRGKQQDTAFSEKEQVERGVDYFIAERKAFFVCSDSGLSGGWPWLDETLIHDLYTAKAIRYHKVYRRLILDNPRYRDQRESAQAYLYTRIEQIVASIREFPEDSAFVRNYLRPGREKLRASTRTIKYRPGLTNLVKKLPLIHTVATADLSRLFRSYDVQVQFGKALQRSGTRVIGTFDTLDWLNASDDDDPDGKGDKLFGRQLTGLVLGKIAEMRLYEVMTGAMRGMIQMLEDGSPHGIIPAWMRRSPKKGIEIVPDARDVVLRCFELYEAGLGATAIMTRLVEQGYTATPLSFNAIKRWLENPLLVGDQEAFGIIWKDVGPAILLDANGSPDRYRFSKVQEMRRERFESDPRFRINRTHPSERHLGAGVAVCVCGKSIVYDGQHSREGENPKKRMPFYHCNSNAQFRSIHPHHRVSLNPDNFYRFLRYLIFTEGEKVLKMLSDSQERDYLMEEVRVLESAARERSTKLEEKRKSDTVYDQALSRARRDAEDDGAEVDRESIEYHLKRLLKPDVADLEKVETELARKRIELGAYILPEQVEVLRQRLATAESMSEPELNALVLSLLKLYFDDTDGGKHPHDPHNLKCYVQWNIAAQALIPVPLRLRWRGSKRDVRLPESSWLEAQFLGDLDD